MTKLQALNKQANNPNAPEQSQAIGELQRVSVSGDWNRYAAKLSMNIALVQKFRSLLAAENPDYDKIRRTV
jgi:hypothetical protein